MKVVWENLPAFSEWVAKKKGRGRSSLSLEGKEVVGVPQFYREEKRPQSSWMKQPVFQVSVPPPVPVPVLIFAFSQQANLRERLVCVPCVPGKPG